MTIQDFFAKTKILEEFYGKEYNNTQKEIMFDDLKNYDVERYEKAIRFLCRINRYKPTLNEILDAIQSDNRNIEEREQVPCKFCGGTGYFQYTKVENGYPYNYVCLCICQNAEGLEYDGTKIADKEHRSQYYIKSAKEVFGDRLAKEEPQTTTQNRDIRQLVSKLTEQMTF